MAFSMYYSLTDYDMINAPTYVGMDNYARLFTDARFLKSIRVTLVYVGISVPVKLIFALFVRYSMYHR